MQFVQVLVNGISLGASLALLAIGLTLIFGILRVVNFAHGALLMLGAYATFYLQQQAGVNYFVAILVSAALLALLGVVLQLGIFQWFHNRLLEGAVAAIALSLLLTSLATAAFSGRPRVTPGAFDSTISIAGVSLSTQRAFIIVCSAVLVLGLHLAVSRTRYGKAMRAVEQDSYAASLQGIDVRAVSVLTFAVGAMLAGLAGGLIAPTQVILPNMGDAPLLLSFVVIILGGMGSVSGALVASLVIGFVQSATTTYVSPQWAILVSFLVAIVILLVKPTGLFGRE